MQGFKFKKNKKLKRKNVCCNIAKKKVGQKLLFTFDLDKSNCLCLLRQGNNTQKN